MWETATHFYDIYELWFRKIILNYVMIMQYALSTQQLLALHPIPKLITPDLCAIQKLAFCKRTAPCGAIQKMHIIAFTRDCSLLVE